MNAPLARMRARLRESSSKATATSRGSNETCITQSAIIPFGSPSSEEPIT